MWINKGPWDRDVCVPHILLANCVIWDKRIYHSVSALSPVKGENVYLRWLYKSKLNAWINALDKNDIQLLGVLSPVTSPIHGLCLLPGSDANVTFLLNQKDWGDPFLGKPQTHLAVLFKGCFLFAVSVHFRNTGVFLNPTHANYIAVNSLIVECDTNSCINNNTKRIKVLKKNRAMLYYFQRYKTGISWLSYF